MAEKRPFGKDRRPDDVSADEILAEVFTPLGADEHRIAEGALAATPRDVDEVLAVGGLVRSATPPTPKPYVPRETKAPYDDGRPLDKLFDDETGASQDPADFKDAERTVDLSNPEVPDQGQRDYGDY